MDAWVIHQQNHETRDKGFNEVLLTTVWPETFSTVEAAKKRVMDHYKDKNKWNIKIWQRTNFGYPWSTEIYSNIDDYKVVIKLYKTTFYLGAKK